MTSGAAVLEESGHLSQRAQPAGTRGGTELLAELTVALGWMSKL